MTANGKGTVAAFDFDGTLTRRDSLFPFLHHFAGTADFFVNLAKTSPALMGYAMRTMRNGEAKEAVLRCFLGDRVLADVAAACETFAAHRLPALLRADAMDRL